jgi:hypothetical protein
MAAQERKGTQTGGSASPKTMSIAEGQYSLSAQRVENQAVSTVSQRVGDNAFHLGS